MKQVVDLFTYKINGNIYALYLENVIRVINAVQVTPLVDAPDYVYGIINVHGNIIPVYNTRKRLLLPDKELDISDYFIIVQTTKRKVALIVDEILEIVKASKGLIDFNLDISAQGINCGVLKLNNEIVLIHDIDKFLSYADEAKLKEALQRLTSAKTAEC